MADKEHLYLKLAGIIVIVSGAITALYGGGTVVYDVAALVATKEYHDQSLDKAIVEKIAPMQTDLESVVAKMSVDRARNIIDLKCSTRGNIPDDVEAILQKTLKRYREIEGRELDPRHCLPSGDTITTYEARQRGLID